MPSARQAADGLLKDKVCVVTGASSGIGLAIARRFAQEGALLCLVARSEERLEAASQGMEGASDDRVVLSSDVTQEEQVTAVVQQTLDRFGAIDILVNSAGAAYFTPIVQTSAAQWDEVLDANLKAVFLLCKHVLPHMLSRGKGDIVNVASIAAHQGFENGTAYCASKHGLLGLSRALALEVRKRGVRVVTVSPGAVDTPLWDPMEATPDRSRMLRAEEVADAVVAALTFSATAVTDELIVMPRDGVL